jgi:hypothetical protein
VARVSGSLTNIIGLPTELVAELLARHGLAPAPAAADRG